MLIMKTYKLITNPSYAESSPITYWVKQTEKYFFNLCTRRKILGDYSFDNGGSVSAMPFFKKSEALKRIKLLESN